MNKSTSNYAMFKFRDDNREKIRRSHVEALKRSISLRNMLDLKPILVNEKMEIIDGQHRFLAASELGVEIFYEVREEITAMDMLLLNCTRAWSASDYLNFFAKQGYEHYIRAAEFCKKNNISATVLLNIVAGRGGRVYYQFKKGEFKFDEKIPEKELDLCWETIDYIKRKNGQCIYLNASKFWLALIKLVKSGNFDEKKWFQNLEKLIERVGPRVSQADYEKMVMDIHNWRNSQKVELVDRFADA